ncbi:MAG: hypothetical protein C0519_06785 [Hyphomicrobium sp.]|nr:hypothetical protein [Hyphomicrobium sp.]
MSFTTCATCGNRYEWSWDEAFDKFGFEDGGGLVMTDHVADFLRSTGLSVTVQQYGFHNLVITDIERDGQSLIPETAQRGYDDPREYLPDDIVDDLDRRFPEGREVQS